MESLKELKELNSLLGLRHENTNIDNSLVDVINECIENNDKIQQYFISAEMNNFENNTERESRQSEDVSSQMVAYSTIEKDKTNICFYDNSLKKRIFDELQIYELALLTYITMHPNHYISIAFIAEPNNATVNIGPDELVLTHMLRIHKKNEES